ncbi:MAG TPA: hypothetical protein VE441_12940 [Mycobacterium sp.]|jgi:hypothetical protein|nr:hypothetical protein [Mycobacterium sp.]
MTAHLYWASPQFRISAKVDFPDQAVLIAAGDFSGAGSAVLGGALAGVARMPVAVHLDASGITALSDDAAAAVGERTADPATLLTVDSESVQVAPVLDAAHLPVAGLLTSRRRRFVSRYRPSGRRRYPVEPAGRRLSAVRHFSAGRTAGCRAPAGASLRLSAQRGAMTENGTALWHGDTAGRSALPGQAGTRTRQRPSADAPRPRPANPDGRDHSDRPAQQRHPRV